MRYSLIPALLAAALTSTATVYAANTNGPYNYAALPAFQGVVAQYLPAPQGGADGVMLADGTEILMTPELGATLPAIARPGDTIKGNGVKGINLPIVHALTITGPHGTKTEDSIFDAQISVPSPISEPDMSADGTIWLPLYDRHGAEIGAILKDHTVIRLPAAEALRLAAWLTPGKPLHVVGTATRSTLGVTINAREIGPNVGHAVTIADSAAQAAGQPPGSAGYDMIGSTISH